MEGCVGGQYIFGAQGERITREFVLDANERYEAYFTEGRLEYLLAIAAKCEETQHIYPTDYAWDCSGLWWDCANELDLYDVYTDRTAEDTYYEYCTPIKKYELRPGDIVFLRKEGEDRVSHMGIVGRNGYVYEAASVFVGVVKKRTIERRLYTDIVRGGVLQCEDWNMFGRPKVFED